jgi:hypothetical protein
MVARGREYLERRGLDSPRLEAEIAAPDVSRDHQRFMMGDVRKLIGPTDDFLGLLVPADYDATIAMLTEAGILSGTPSPAWTHSLWLQAQ